MLSKLKKYQNLDVRSLLNQSIRDNEKAILALNQSQMYDEGVMDINRPQSQLEYAESTKRQKLKKARYKEVGHITLRWFGDFYQAMKIVFFSDRFVIVSDDLKWANWLEPQGRFSKALGLTEKNKSRLRDIVRDSLIRRLRNV